MSRIADLLRKTRQRERERNPAPDGAEPGDGHSLQWMADVDIPWQIGGQPRSFEVPPAEPVATGKAPAVAAPVLAAPQPSVAAAAVVAPPRRLAAPAVATAAGAAKPSLAGPVVDSPQRPVPTEVAEVVRRLFFSGDGKAVHRVLFSGVDESAARGKLVRQVAEGLARVCAGHVCLADLDVRRPTLDHHFGLEGRPGFSDIVMESDNAVEAVHQSSSIPRLSVMPTGTRAAGNLPKAADREVLARLTQAFSPFDYVVALTASFEEHRDAIVLAPAFDGVVLVAESGTTDPGAVRAAARALNAAGIRLLGTIIENTSTQQG